MTDKQIKQNAWNDLGRYTPCDENEWIDGYVVGAHSRDEEIAYLIYRLNDATEKLQTVIAERDNLRNPWISVEDRLPEDDGEVCILFGNEHTLLTAKYIDGRWMCILFEVDNVTHWMPIPELNKGE